jgi:hypothetical protein
VAAAIPKLRKTAAVSFLSLMVREDAAMKIRPFGVGLGELMGNYLFR